MSIIRSVVSFGGVSGLPDDVFQNTFHFDDNDIEATAVVTAEIGAALNRFYCAAPAGGTQAIMNYMPGPILSGSARVDHYQLDIDGNAGSPIGYSDLLGFDPGDGPALPHEVAACLSFRAYIDDAIPEEIPAGPVGPAGDLRLRSRRRGRIFHGPLSNAAVTTADGRARLAPAYQINLVQAGEALMNDAGLAADSVDWCVYSRVDGLARPVTGGWVDNSFDTQRRRGIAATTRAPFGDAE